MDRHDNLAAELAAVISVALARGWLEGHMHTEGNPYTVRIRGEYVLIGRGPGVEPRSERRLTPAQALDWMVSPEDLPPREQPGG